MASTPGPDTPPKPRRVKKRWMIPLILLVLIVALLLFAYVRGTWADSKTKDPKTSADGVITQLYQEPNGRKNIRAALVIDAPPAAVWAVVSDYANHDKIFRYVSKSEAARDPDGRYHLTGVAHSSLWGDWPYDTHVSHIESAGTGEFIASWDEPSGPISVNRGSWAVKPAGGAADKTLLVYTLDVEVGGYPPFFVRNLVLDRIGKLMTDVQTAVKKRQSP